MGSFSLGQQLSRVRVIFKKEALTFIYTPTVYVCCALFVFFANYLNFVLGHFFERDQASLASSFLAGTHGSTLFFRTCDFNASLV